MEIINELLGYRNLKIVQKKDGFHFSLDSVLLAEFVFLASNTKKILDIGTGNAPIPLILGTKTEANIIGVEIQNEIFDLAEKSVALNQMGKKINIIAGDINILYKDFEAESIDVITCNPPFFEVAKTKHKNSSILKTIARHELHLNVDNIFEISKRLLVNGGRVAIVHRPERLVDIILTMKKYNIEPKRLRFVFPKKDKEANVLLIEGTKNGKQGLKIENPLIIHNEDGSYTCEAKKILG